MSCTKAANLPVTSSFDIYTAFSSGICCLTPNIWCDLHAGVWLNVHSNIHATGIHNTPTHNKQLTDTLNWHTKHSYWQIKPSPQHKTYSTNTHSHTKKTHLIDTHTLSHQHTNHICTLSPTHTQVKFVLFNDATGTHWFLSYHRLLDVIHMVTLTHFLEGNPLPPQKE